MGASTRLKPCLPTSPPTPAANFVEGLRFERERELRTPPFRSILIGVQLSIVPIVFGAALPLLHPSQRALPAEWFSQVLSLP
jgi:hypothetical protein